VIVFIIIDIHNTIIDAISRLGYDPTVSIKQLRATLRQKSTRTQKAVRDKTGRQSQVQWCKLKVVTNKHEDFNLVFTNHGKEDGIYPPRTKKPSEEIAKAQTKINNQGSI
jgi:hypothetical protein